MGEPALNEAVLDAIAALPSRLHAPGLILSLSTIAPAGCEGFFERLLEIKDDFRAGTFQFQFSFHSSDEGKRREIIPARTWSFAEMAAYGRRFFRSGDRKITLNFALAQGFPLEAKKLAACFDPDLFLIKITPVNPTVRALANDLRPVFSRNGRHDGLSLNSTGKDTKYSFPWANRKRTPSAAIAGSSLAPILQGKGIYSGRGYSYPLEIFTPSR